MTRIPDFSTVALNSLPSTREDGPRVSEGLERGSDHPQHSPPLRAGSAGHSPPPRGDSLEDWLTPEGIPVKGEYGPEDRGGLDFLDTWPGLPPYVRGPYPTMYVT